MRINFNAGGGQPSGPLGKIIATLVGLLTLAAAFMFSLVFVVVLAIAGLIVWGYFWWKTREVRRRIKEAQESAQPFGQAPTGGTGDGDIIEGEAVRVDEDRNRLSN